MSTESSFNRVARDVMDLVELQMQLLSVDADQARQRMTRAIACGGVAATLSIATLTILLAGSSLLLAEQTQLSYGGSFMIVAFAMLAIVSALTVVAINATKAAADAMNETKSEFAENLRWLKATLVKPSTSPRNTMRSESFPQWDRFEETNPDRTNPEKDRRSSFTNHHTPRYRR